MALIGYGAYRIFRFLFGGSFSAKRQPYQQQSQRRKEPDLRNRKTNASSTEKTYQGGEYVDYEEVE